MTKRLPYLMILATCLILSCKTEIQESKPIDGTWKSIGYGKVLNIESGRYYFYDITKISCLSGKQGEVSSFGEAIQLLKDTLLIIKGPSTYYYTRINELPNLCGQELSESKKIDPLYNFEVLANTIQEHYAYFKLNKINWDSLYNEQLNKITPNLSDVKLYLVLEEMINKLNDNHGYIEPTDEVYEQVRKLEPVVEETKQLKEYGDFQIAQMVADHYLEENLTKDTWLMQWGKMENNIGYIQVKSMWLFADLHLSDSLVQKKGFVDTYVEAFNQLNEVEYINAETEAVSRIMDKVITDLANTKYIILDVRFNGGGQDAVSLEILKRFTDKKIQVATKRAKLKNSYTKKIPIFIEPSEKYYEKPVYLLTSQQSASATDFMALASLEFNHIKRIGSHTDGALSDALEKRLPNGWYFSISNEEYFDPQGFCYESIGIPVNYELNYPEDRQTFFRSVANDLEQDKKNILQAIEELRMR